MTTDTSTLVKRIHACLHGDTPGEDINPDECSALLAESADALEAAQMALAPFANMATTLERDVDGTPIFNDTQIHVGRGKVRLMPLGSFRAARDWLARYAERKGGDDDNAG